MDKFDNSIDGVENDEFNGVNQITDDNAPSRYKYILYLSLFVIFVILVIVVLRALFTNEPPLAVLNEMLNNALEIKAVSI